MTQKDLKYEIIFGNEIVGNEHTKYEHKETGEVYLRLSKSSEMYLKTPASVYKRLSDGKIEDIQDKLMRVIE